MLLSLYFQCWLSRFFGFWPHYVKSGIWDFISGSKMRYIAGHQLSADLKQRTFYVIIQFSSGTQSCPTLCDPMNCSMPGLPVHHRLPEFTQTHAHWVGDAIQPSHPLSSPSPPAFNLSQHQGLFKWVSSSSFSFSISPSNEYSGLIFLRMDWLDLLAVQGTLKSLLTTVQKHQIFGAQLSLWFNSHIQTWLPEKP